MRDEPYTTRVYIDALEPSTIAAVKDTAEALSHCSNYWIPRETIESGHGATPTERAITALVDLVRPSLPLNWAGAEYWVQMYDAGRGLAFHFDKDEHAMKEEGRMVNPIFSSVLYLTGGGDCGNSPPPPPSSSDARVQAPTVVNDQFYNQETHSTVPEDPTRSTFIFPRKNSYCLFDGRLGHGVLDTGCKKERITLLINWWQLKPENIDRIEIPGKEGESTANGAKALPLLPPQQTLPECIYPETIQVTEAELGEDDMVFIDDLLAARGISLIGKDAVHAVTIKHPKLCLYPVDNEQLIEMEEQSEFILQVAACLAPLQDPSATSSSSSSENSE
ncbi:hypothetical protein Ndes2526B_g06625 [Nannochloris sp. 'desiccata']|nr:hypothetical protein NADE_006476 [Chlorella desiccata (nom. nud.)]